MKLSKIVIFKGDMKVVQKINAILFWFILFHARTHSLKHTHIL